MIYEFALEPELVAQWADPKKYLFFREKFGQSTRRIVSQYPKKWERLVMKAFYCGPEKDDPIAEKRLTEIVKNLMKGSIIRESLSPELKTWLEKAEAEHDVRPFHAIVASENPRGQGKVITSNLLINGGSDEGELPLWKVPDIPVVKRRADALARQMSPLLKTAQSVLVIDPYFDPAKKQFKDSFSSFLGEIWNNRIAIGQPAVEVHTSIDRMFKNREKGPDRNPEEEKRTCRYLKDKLNSTLSPIIPVGKQIQVYIWKEKVNGQRFHNRYILTDILGVLFGTGTDEAPNPSSDETDVLTPLSFSQKVTIWDQYKRTPSAFDPVIPAFDILGKKQLAGKYGRGSPIVARKSKIL